MHLGNPSISIMNNISSGCKDVKYDNKHTFCSTCSLGKMHTLFTPLSFSKSTKTVGINTIRCMGSRFYNINRGIVTILFLKMIFLIFLDISSQVKI